MKYRLQFEKPRQKQARTTATTNPGDMRWAVQTLRRRCGAWTMFNIVETIDPDFDALPPLFESELNIIDWHLERASYCQEAAAEFPEDPWWVRQSEWHVERAEAIFRS